MTMASAMRFCNPWRILGWGTAMALVLAPLVAMRFTDQVNWSPLDFAFAIAMFGGFGLALEWTLRPRTGAAFRLGAGVALATAFLLIWINGAVGIVGGDGDAANRIVLAVPAIALIGVLLSGWRADGLSRAMFAAAAAQAALAAMVPVAGLDAKAIPLCTAFAALWLAAGLLFRKAARTVPG